MQHDLVRRFSAPVPRYTSYPTAPHFSSDVDHGAYRHWLAQLPAAARLSLYVHIPFCQTLCWFCGCHTRGAGRYETLTTYLGALDREIETVAGTIPERCTVQHIHWGGGSPDILRPADIERLAALLQTRFQIAADAEFAVEIDPRKLADDRIAAFAAAGVNRISVGVQDFNPDVQRAINRHQSFEETKSAVDRFRAHGIPSVNIDLVYGLPHQTRDSVASTISRAIELLPDRIALFGYAHLPSKLARQRLIPEGCLPDTVERFAQANRAASILAEAGYVRIGLDHFARPQDSLAIAAHERRLRRNFQGYTTDAADALIGLGASSIGQLPQGYVANTVSVADYQQRVAESGLATLRGYELTCDDRMRAFAIERLMCDLAFPTCALRERFGESAERLIAEAEDFASLEGEGFVTPDPRGFIVTERGRPFLRTICACFDAHLGTGLGTHAAGV